MNSVNVHEAKAHLSRLLEKVAAGETVIIAEAGKPVAKLVPFAEAKAPRKRQLGGLRGQFTVPEDIDRFAEEEIVEMFEGSE